MLLVIIAMMLLKTCILFYIIAFVVVASKGAVLPWQKGWKNYCDNRYCGQEHMACNLQQEYGVKCPPTAHAISMVKLKFLILELHNKRRNEIAGGIGPFKPAVRMAEMIWNYELARLALIHSKICDFAVDKCRSTDLFRVPGQNSASYLFNGTERTDENLVNDRVGRWITITDKFPIAVIAMYPPGEIDSKIKSFTLGINQANNHIGCGAVRYTIDISHYFFITCNYANNNFVGMPVYETGNTPGSACESGKSSNYPNLCSTKEIYPAY